MADMPNIPNMQSILHPIVGPKKEIHDLTGRVALVTGGALGIGFEISKAFAEAGCKVFMTNRKEEQGKEAIQKIKDATNGKADIDWFPCDLGDLNEVKKTFTEFRDKHDRLDLLILSAGINSNKFGKDNDGIDRHFGVNWLGHFYAINLLYPLMRKTSKMPNVPAPRIVFESSEMHRMAPKDVHFASIEEINDKDMDPMALYGRTKLAMILGTKYGIYEKVIKKNNDHIFVSAVHPGAVATDMQDQWKDAYPGILGKAAEAVSLLFSRDPEQGSYSALWAATSPEVEEKGWNGYYFTDPSTPGKETDQASDRNLGIALWDLSSKLVKEKVGDDALEKWDA